MRHIETVCPGPCRPAHHRDNPRQPRRCSPPLRSRRPPRIQSATRRPASSMFASGRWMNAPLQNPPTTSHGAGAMPPPNRWTGPVVSRDHRPGAVFHGRARDLADRFRRCRRLPDRATTPPRRPGMSGPDRDGHHAVLVWACREAGLRNFERGDRNRPSNWRMRWRRGGPGWRRGYAGATYLGRQRPAGGLGGTPPSVGVSYLHQARA
jgi:hypothetical protein